MSKQEWFNIGQVIINCIYAVWSVIIHRRASQDTSVSGG